MKTKLTIVALLIAVSTLALGEDKPAEPAARMDTHTTTATIDVIDYQARLITLKDEDGNYDTLYAGPEIKRFNELKVGDKITFTSTESVVLKLKKPGEAAAAASAKDPEVSRGTGPKPSGSIKQQETATVLIKAIDPKVPAVTVQAEDGRTMSFKIENKDLIKDIKPGDRVEITYTTALMISVK